MTTYPHDLTAALIAVNALRKFASDNIRQFPEYANCVRRNEECIRSVLLQLHRRLEQEGIRP